MGSGQLAKLESLSEKRADQTRLRVNGKQRELDQLNRQRDELIAINHEYQKAPDTEVLVAPSMLAHRRAFVSRLAEQIDVLNTQRHQQRRVLEQHVQEHRTRSAQSAAIGAVRVSREREEKLVTERLEQSISDEAGRAISRQLLAQLQEEDYD